MFVRDSHISKKDVIWSDEQNWIWSVAIRFFSESRYLGHLKTGFWDKHVKTIGFLVRDFTARNILTTEFGDFTFYCIFQFMPWLGICRPRGRGEALTIWSILGMYRPEGYFSKALVSREGYFFPKKKVVKGAFPLHMWLSMYEWIMFWLEYNTKWLHRND